MRPIGMKTFPNQPPHVVFAHFVGLRRQRQLVTVQNKMAYTVLTAFRWIQRLLNIVRDSAFSCVYSPVP